MQSYCQRYRAGPTGTLGPCPKRTFSVSVRSSFELDQADSRYAMIKEVGLGEEAGENLVVEDDGTPE